MLFEFVTISFSKESAKIHKKRHLAKKFFILSTKKSNKILIFFEKNETKRCLLTYIWPDRIKFFFRKRLLITFFNIQGY